MSNSINLNLDTTKSEIQNPRVVLRQGDGNYQTLRVTMTSNGEATNLSNSKVVFMGETAGQHKIIDENVNKIDAYNGIFEYRPPKQWGQDTGYFRNAYFKISNADQVGSTASFKVEVQEAVDLTAEEAVAYVSVVDDMIKRTEESVSNEIAKVDNQLNANSAKIEKLNNAINNGDFAQRATDNTFSGSQTVQKDLTVNGKTILSGDNYVAGLQVNGPFEVNKNAVFNAHTWLNGFTDLAAGLVWGDFTVKGAIHGKADTAGRADVANTLDNSRDYLVNSLQTASHAYLANAEAWGLLNHGTFTNNGDVTVNGSIHGTADVAKALPSNFAQSIKGLEVTDYLTAKKMLYVDQDATINRMQMTGQAVLAGKTYTNDLQVNGPLEINSNTTANKNFVVQGHTWLNGSVDLNNTLNWGGLTVKGTTNLGGDTVTNKLDVNGPAFMHGDLTVFGKTRPNTIATYTKVGNRDAILYRSGNNVQLTLYKQGWWNPDTGAWSKLPLWIPVGFRPSGTATGTFINSWTSGTVVFFSDGTVATADKGINNSTDIEIYASWVTGDDWP